jgi:hypothetical protein
MITPILYLAQDALSALDWCSIVFDLYLYSTIATVLERLSIKESTM